MHESECRTCHASALPAFCLAGGFLLGGGCIRRLIIPKGPNCRPPGPGLDGVASPDEMLA